MADFIVPGRAGIELQFVAPPDGLGLNLEIERAPDAGGSPGTWEALDVLERIAVVRTIYQDCSVAIGSGYYWYRARLSGPGVSPGSYITIAEAVAPGWLLPQAYAGDPGESVLGQTETLRIPHTAFGPDSDTSEFDHNLTEVRPRNAGVQSDLQALFFLPPGTTITAFRSRLLRVNAGDSAQMVLYRTTDAPSSTSIASNLPGTSAGWQTLTASLTEVAAPGNGYVVTCTLRGAVSTGNAGCMWAEIDFIRNSYRQG